MKTYSLILIAIFFASCSTSEKNSSLVTSANYIETENFAKRNLPFSQAVQFGNILYLSGQIGDLETGELIEGGIVPETNQTMKNIRKVLEENGSSMDNIIKCTCMLADISEWSQMSTEYLNYFPNHKPARSAFGTTGLTLGARVEIECIAYIE